MRNTIPNNAVTIPSKAKLVFKGVIYDVYQWEQTLFDGSTATFEMLKRPDTVKILAIKDDQLLILEQEQPNQRRFYDIPGGMHDHEDETELEAAQRELLEETGMKFKTWKLLSVKQPHRKIEQFVYIFLAMDFIESVEPNVDDGEKIKLHLMSLTDAKNILASAEARFFPDNLKDIELIEDLYELAPYN
jgi:ADP-ribose pyrophosphatase